MIVIPMATLQLVEDRSVWLYHPIPNCPSPQSQVLN
eukprot:CAMPEP_0115169500 /NCGR_PEP_ID=MMETSP0270-20121206/1300_1 /TAXON_ID=71861 /ORGANISM="Scrippsiella trochoidea, Strain CCMP3099" /LENGTH=35 /DNA_ID= /DNA_START= /DNA_END= /DNA_ORIENTATION=